MDFLNINLVAAVAMGLFVLAIVEWLKTPKMPKWAVRVIAFVISFALLALIKDWTQSFDVQEFLKMGLVVGGMATGIWHTSKNISISRANNMIP